MKNRQVNWRGMQAAGARKLKDGFQMPGDVNVKCMSMGSWHADASKEGACRRRKGVR